MPEPAQGSIYGDAALVLEAAAAGQGVALARSALAADDIATHRLVRLFDIENEDDYGWFLVWRTPLSCEPELHEEFRHWLARDSRAWVDQTLARRA